MTIEFLNEGESPLPLSLEDECILLVSTYEHGRLPLSEYAKNALLLFAQKIDAHSHSGDDPTVGENRNYDLVTIILDNKYDYDEYQRRLLLKTKRESVANEARDGLIYIAPYIYRPVLHKIAGEESKRNAFLLFKTDLTLAIANSSVENKDFLHEFCWQCMYASQVRAQASDLIKNMITSETKVKIAPGFEELFWQSKWFGRGIKDAEGLAFLVHHYYQSKGELDLRASQLFQGDADEAINIFMALYTAKMLEKYKKKGITLTEIRRSVLFELLNNDISNAKEKLISHIVNYEDMFSEPTHEIFAEDIFARKTKKNNASEFPVEQANEVDAQAYIGHTLLGVDFDEGGNSTLTLRYVTRNYSYEYKGKQREMYRLECFFVDKSLTFAIRNPVFADTKIVNFLNSVNSGRFYDIGSMGNISNSSRVEFSTEVVEKIRTFLGVANTRNLNTLNTRS